MGPQKCCQISPYTASALCHRCEAVAKRFDAPDANGPTPAAANGAGTSGTSAGDAAGTADAAAPAAAEEAAGEAAPVAAEVATAAAGPSQAAALPVAAIVPTPAAQPRPKPLPIAVGGSFTAVHKPSAKTAQGKEQFVVTIPWDDAKMYHKAKLAMFVPKIMKAITTTLPQRPRDDTLSITLTLPSSVGTESFTLGAVSIISGPKPPPPVTMPPAAPQPIAPPVAPPAAPQPVVQPAAPMPIVAAVPIQAAVQSTLAHAAAVTAAAAAVAPTSARPAVVAVAVSKAKPAAKPRESSAQPKRASKAAKRAPAKPRKPAKSSKRARDTTPAPAPSSRSGRSLKAAAKFGDNGEMAGPASKYRSATTASKPLPPASVEWEVPAWAQPGAQIFAWGLHAGVRKRFHATVIKLRTSFPRIVVRYDSTEAGGTSAIELPELRSAYLTKSDIERR